MDKMMAFLKVPLGFVYLKRVCARVALQGSTVASHTYCHCQFHA